MVAPINNPKLNISTDLDVDGSCNCYCCPSFLKTPTSNKTQTGGEAEKISEAEDDTKAPTDAKKYWDAKHPSWGRAFSKRNIKSASDSPRIDEKTQDMERAAEKTYSGSARYFTFKNTG